MRALAALLLAANAWATSCAVLPPCYAVRPDLTVVLAEALENHHADKTPEAEDNLIPIRLKQKTLLYGHSPGPDFTWHHFASIEVRAGDRFYLEETPDTNFRPAICGISGTYSEVLHAPRVQYFRELATGQHAKASFRLMARENHGHDLPRLTATLSGPAGRFRKITNSHGTVEWPALPPGRYTIALSKPDYLPSYPGEALAPVDLPRGACNNRYVSMQTRFTLSGSARTPDGKPAAGLSVRLEQLYETAEAATTTDATGNFTLAGITPGEYALSTGDSQGERNPYPTTYYPGAPSRDQATRVSIGRSQPNAQIQLTVPDPFPTRDVIIHLTHPEWQRRRLLIPPKISAAEGVVYRQKWSGETSAITATVRADLPLRFRIVTWLQPNPITTSPEHQIPAGAGPVTLQIQLQ